MSGSELMIERYCGNTRFESLKVTCIHNWGRGGAWPTWCLIRRVGQSPGHTRGELLLYRTRTLHYANPTSPSTGKMNWDSIDSNKMVHKTLWHCSSFTTSWWNSSLAWYIRIQKDQDCRLHNDGVTTTAGTVDRVRCWYWCSIVSEC